MDKDSLRKFIEEELVARNIELEDAEEIAESVAERCDEEGLFLSDRESKFLGDDD